MSQRSEQRSGVEDWRSAAQARDQRPSFLKRWSLPLALLVVVAAVVLVWWFARP